MKYLHTVFFVFTILLNVPAQVSPEEQAGQPDTEEQLAGQYYSSGEWAKAADLYGQLFEKSPAVFYYTQLMNCYLNLNDGKSAEKLVQKQIRRNPRQIIYLVDLAHVYQKTGEEDKSIKQYDKALKELDPRDDRQVLDLAAAYEKRGHPARAIQTYLLARKVVQGGYRYNLELAALYGKQNDLPGMIDEYSELINTQGYNFLEQIEQSLQDLVVADPGGEKTSYIRDRFVKEIQKNPDNLIFSDLLIWLYVQRKDFESAFIQSRAIDKRLRENGRRVIELARIAISNEQYEVGRKAYQYVIDKGPGELYFQARKELSVALYRKLVSSVSYTPEELIELRVLLQQTHYELGGGEPAAPVAIRLSHLLAFYLNRPDSALTILEPYLNPGAGLAPRMMNEVKLEIADIQLLKGEIWEATLTYSQVEKAMKNDTLGQEAKFRNSKLAYYKGEFEWAKAQLDILKAATSKLIANDALELSLLIADNTVYDTTGEALRMFARADLCLYQNQPRQALETLDSLANGLPGTTLADDILYRKAIIAARQGRYQDATTFLDQLLSAYRTDILADNALFMLAGLFEKQLNNPEKAMDLYKELMTDFPGSLYVVEARKRFRMLRGDTVQ
jgi:tetratricopeptide (TPR) repeat protein